MSTHSWAIGLKRLIKSLKRLASGSVSVSRVICRSIVVGFVSVFVDLVGGLADVESESDVLLFCLR